MICAADNIAGMWISKIISFYVKLLCTCSIILGVFNILRAQKLGPFYVLFFCAHGYITWFANDPFLNGPQY